MIPVKRTEWFWVGCVIALVLVLFLPSFFTLQETFNLGDYGVQHYPWAKFFWEEVSNGRFPLWTPLFHAGFPLAAEGQVGAFYPIHLLLFSLLPFKGAQNLNILLHFFFGFFFLYFYLRSLSLSSLASWVGGFVWTFGSAYAGVEYNFMTMRVLVWLPFVFYHLDLLI